MEILKTCWSGETSSKWSESKPGRGPVFGQGVVIQDRFGGRLLKTRVGGTWHFYNEIQGLIYDFTSSQFPGGIQYTHEPADRAEALSDAAPIQYAVLAGRFSRKFSSE